MPSAVHEAVFASLHVAFVCFFHSIPYPFMALNVNVLCNAEASSSNPTIPDLRVSFQTMTNFKKTVYVLIIGETAFSQYWRALRVKFKRTIRLNPELLMVIMAVVEECTQYRSPKKKSYTTNMLREKSPRSSDSFNAATGTLPALCNPVVVEGHTWCSIRSVRFKVWVRGAGPIDINTKNSDLVASGTLYPVEDMAAVYAMIQKGAQLAREKLISLSQKHDPHIDIEAMRAPLFILRSDAIITNIAGAMSETAHRRYMAWYEEHHTPKAAKMASDAMLIASDAAQAARFDSNEGPAFHMSLRPRTKCACGSQGHASPSRSCAQVTPDESPAFHMSLRPRTKHGGGTRGRAPPNRSSAPLRR
ncbi:hypothetical protein EDB19DRAFT_1978090 [Suillus lakei]|nr:hypothetical protein EDB19DRAFT_1978090 [Suillus lakei]